MKSVSISKTKEGATVIVPTLNRGHFLENCLMDLLAQDYQPIEILVVDQSDQTSETVQRIIRENASIISYHNVNFTGLPKARNYGWQQARYERLIYIDDDVRCGPEFISNHVQSLNHSQIGAVAGGIDEKHKTNNYRGKTGRFIFWTATPVRGFEAHGTRIVDAGGGGNFSIWRQLLKVVDGFDEELDVGPALYEETEMFLRLRETDYKIWFNGQARLTHLAASSGGCRVNEVDDYMYGLARNRGVLMRRNLNAYHLPTAVVRLFMLAGAYAKAYKKISVFKHSYKGLRTGWKEGKKDPVCSDFSKAEIYSEKY
jgi:GT2 family glycosyltransferase